MWESLLALMIVLVIPATAIWCYLAWEEYFRLRRIKRMEDPWATTRRL